MVCSVIILLKDGASYMNARNTLSNCRTVKENGGGMVCIYSFWSLTFYENFCILFHIHNSSGKIVRYFSFRVGPSGVQSDVSELAMCLFRDNARRNLSQAKYWKVMVAYLMILSMLTIHLYN
jgi:hypothetical protein